MSTPAVTVAGLRIGEVATLLGTTTRTLRYYEEIGLLPRSEDRAAGSHRLYGERDVERLRDALRLKELLGVSLDELKELLEAEEARAALRDEWHRGSGPGSDPLSAARRREILDQATAHLDKQLRLVRGRRKEIDRLESELTARRRRVQQRLRTLSDDA